MWYMILIIFILIIIGLILDILDIRNRIKEYDFTTEYYRKFNELLSDILDKKTSFNSNEYNWIISNSDKMQSILGEVGMISYKERGFIYKNIPILLNVTNDLLSYGNDISIEENDVNMINWCQNAFLRKIGILDGYIKNQPKRLLNPFYNLTRGIRWFLGVPINILYNIGLISYKGKNKIKENILFKIISGIISLLTIFSAILSIVIGWNDFLEILKCFFIKC